MIGFAAGYRYITETTATSQIASIIRPNKYKRMRSNIITTQIRYFVVRYTCMQYARCRSPNAPTPFSSHHISSIFMLSKPYLMLLFIYRHSAALKTKLTKRFYLRKSYKLDLYVHLALM